MNEMKKITDEELASFLEGSLPEDRMTEVATVIDNNKHLQAIVEATIDVDSMLMFDELRLVKRNPQGGNNTTSFSIVMTDSNTDTKSSKSLFNASGSHKETANWQQEEYRQAADRKRDSLQIHREKPIINEESGHSYWAGVVIGIIGLIIMLLIRTFI